MSVRKASDEKVNKRLVKATNKASKWLKIIKQLEDKKKANGSLTEAELQQYEHAASRLKHWQDRLDVWADELSRREWGNQTGTYDAESNTYTGNDGSVYVRNANNSGGTWSRDGLTGNYVRNDLGTFTYDDKQYLFFKQAQLNGYTANPVGNEGVTTSFTNKDGVTINQDGTASYVLGANDSRIGTLKHPTGDATELWKEGDVIQGTYTVNNDGTYALSEGLGALVAETPVTPTFNREKLSYNFSDLQGNWGLTNQDFLNTLSDELLASIAGDADENGNYTIDTNKVKTWQSNLVQGTKYAGKNIYNDGKIGAYTIAAASANDGGGDKYATAFMNASNTNNAIWKDRENMKRVEEAPAARLGMKFLKGGKASASQDKGFQLWIQKLGEDGLKQLQLLFIEQLQLDPLIAAQFSKASDQEKQLAFLLFAYYTYQQTTSKGNVQGSLVALPNQIPTVPGNAAYSPGSSNPTPFTQAADYQVRAAKVGMKFAHIAALNGRCPEGYELVREYKVGGEICGRCAKKRALMQNTVDTIKAACGAKAKKRVNAAKCGNKVKKHDEGGVLDWLKKIFGRQTSNGWNTTPPTVTYSDGPAVQETVDTKHGVQRFTTNLNGDAGVDGSFTESYSGLDGSNASIYWPQGQGKGKKRVVEESRPGVADSLSYRYFDRLLPKTR